MLNLTATSPQIGIFASVSWAVYNICSVSSQRPADSEQSDIGNTWSFLNDEVFESIKSLGINETIAQYETIKDHI